MFGSNHKSILEPKLGPGFLFCPSCQSTIDSQLGPDILFPVDSRTSTYNSGQSFLSQLQVYRQLATGSNLFCPSCKSIIDSQLWGPACHLQVEHRLATRVVYSMPLATRPSTCNSAFCCCFAIALVASQPSTRNWGGGGVVLGCLFVWWVVGGGGAVECEVET